MLKSGDQGETSRHQSSVYNRPSKGLAKGDQIAMWCAHTVDSAFQRKEILASVSACGKRASHGKIKTI